MDLDRLGYLKMGDYMEKLDFELVGNSAIAPAMAHYMKDKFEFIGIKSVERKAQSRDLLNRSTNCSPTTIKAWINELYARKYREYQYVAIDLAIKNIQKWHFTDIMVFKQLVTQKSWWDSVDPWRTFFGKYVKRHLDEKEKVFELFYQSQNFWERRVAINLQLMEKETLDTDMLTHAILYDQKTDEFFIQKAIGWSLRQYSKYNPDWVRQFLKAHELSKLAVKEGSKYLS